MADKENNGHQNVALAKKRERVYNIVMSLSTKKDSDRSVFKNKGLNMEGHLFHSDEVEDAIRKTVPSSTYMMPTSLSLRRSCDRRLQASCN